MHRVKAISWAELKRSLYELANTIFRGTRRLEKKIHLFNRRVRNLRQGVLAFYPGRLFSSSFGSERPWFPVWQGQYSRSRFGRCLQSPSSLIQPHGCHRSLLRIWHRRTILEGSIAWLDAQAPCLDSWLQESPLQKNPLMCDLKTHFT